MENPSGMQRALILGGGGMLGHKLWQELSDRLEAFTPYVTVRRPARAYAPLELFKEEFVIDNIDVTQSHDLHRAFAVARPNVVFNAVGIIKQLKQAYDPVISLTINALLPHQLAGLCAACGARLIHVSTDCVFSGRRGGYTEGDTPDPEDLYGRAKLLGETSTDSAPNAITVRTSMIGREIETRSGLIEWFLSQRGNSVKGFRRAIYTGFTTLELARVLADIAQRHSHLKGVWQVSSDPIDKYELLTLVNELYGTQTNILPDMEFACDRSLDSTRFRVETGYVPPTWRAQIQEMRDDPTPYERWRAY